jgi:hypothetical protein
MVNDDMMRNPADPMRININEHYELAYWARHLSVSREELSEAARRAGPKLDDIKRQLVKGVD